MIGSRRRDEAHYHVSELAARYDASVAAETDQPDEAYSDWQQYVWEQISAPWPPSD